MDALRRARWALRNWWRGRGRFPPYVVLPLEGPIQELSTRPEAPAVLRWLLPVSPGPLTVRGLRRLFAQLAYDERVRGVVLKISCSAAPAVYQSLSEVLADFRQRGKRLIAYAEQFGPFQYYLACACDEIIMPPSAEWDVLGFYNEYVFLKDAIDRLAVKVDVVNVSPFKSAGEPFVRNDFSAEAREQAEWLLEARFDALVRRIAEGRRLDPAQVRALIDRAPFSAPQAVALGLLDKALYEDELDDYLQDALPPLARGRLVDRFARIAKRLRPERGGEARPRKACIAIDAVRHRLRAPFERYARQEIAIVPIEGLISPGRSRRLPAPLPLFDDQLAGAETIVALLRAAEQDDQIAAVILFVNSSGGAALASDLIARAVRRLKRKKPVVAYLGSTAASGGYYVSALANCIVAQPLTITGSIGVVALRPYTREAFERVGVHRVALRRGQRAGLFSDAEPVDDEKRQVLADLVARAYQAFKQVVAEGRSLSVEVLEPICGGRVWTGAQAQARGLVDALGSFEVAVERARSLAGLPADRSPRVYVLTSRASWASFLPVFSRAWPAVDELRALFGATRVWALAPWWQADER
jgi:protease-4